MRFCSIRRVAPYGSAPFAALRMMSQFRFIEDLLVLVLSLPMMRARAKAIDVHDRAFAQMRSRHPVRPRSKRDRSPRIVDIGHVRRRGSSSAAAGIRPAHALRTGRGLETKEID